MVAGFDPATSKSGLIFQLSALAASCRMGPHRFRYCIEVASGSQVPDGL
jgi:hypothetical protein